MIIKYSNIFVCIIQSFVDDSLSECAVKRRCVAQNVVYIIEHAKNSTIMAKIALNRSLSKLKRPIELRKSTFPKSKLR